MRSRDQESLTSWDDDDVDPPQARRRPAASDDPDEPAPPATSRADLDDRLRRLEMRLRAKVAQPGAGGAQDLDATGRTPMGTRIALVSGIALCVAFMAFLVYRLIPGAGSVPTPAAPSTTATATTPPPAEDDPVAGGGPAEATIPPSEAFREAKQAIESFVRAETIDDKLAFVRPTPDVRAHMEQLAEHELMTQREVPPWGSRFISRGSFVYAEVFQPKLGFRGVVVEKTDDGWKVDFDSWIGYNETPFDQLVASAADEPVVVRALGRIRGDFDTGVPGDYVVVLRDPDQQLGATARISVLDIENEAAFEILKSGRTIPLIIELDGRPAPGETVGSLRVTRIVEAGWFQDPVVGSLLFPAGAEEGEPELDATAPIEDDPGTTLSFD